MPENNGGYTAVGFGGQTSKLVYSELTTDNPIDLTRWQVVNCYMGRIGLINCGGASTGASDLAAGRAHRRDQQASRRHGPDHAAARPSSGRWTRASPSSTPSRTCT